MKYIQIYEKFSKTVEMYINDIFNKEWMDNFRDENEHDFSDEDFIKYKNEYIKLLNNNVIGDYITLYRKVHISSIKNLNVNKIGVYWSFDKNPSSYHYYGFNVENDNDNEFILKANFKLSDINWGSSLYTWFIFADIQRENEVRVNENISFNKLSYSINNKPYKTISGNFNIGKNKDNINESVNENQPKKYKVYHGTNDKFETFDLNKSDIFWFTDSIDSIKNGTHGGVGSKYIMTRYITLKKPADWDLYDKYSIDELINLGYDSVILEDDGKTDYIVFNPSSISKN